MMDKSPKKVVPSDCANKLFRETLALQNEVKDQHEYMTALKNLVNKWDGETNKCTSEIEEGVDLWASKPRVYTSSMDLCPCK